ncbi:MAG TPA: hypothetical protein VK934_12335 [Fimbriimonas sp.]|nr:hypothetical protein [Fimbriimonas sp.]
MHETLIPLGLDTSQSEVFSYVQAMSAESKSRLLAEVADTDLENESKAAGIRLAQLAAALLPDSSSLVLRMIRSTESPELVFAILCALTDVDDARMPDSVLYEVAKICELLDGKLPDLDYITARVVLNFADRPILATLVPRMRRRQPFAVTLTSDLRTSLNERGT